MLVYNNTDFLGEEKVPFGEGDYNIKAPRRGNNSPGHAARSAPVFDLP
jgi:hypothetical protein